MQRFNWLSNSILKLINKFVHCKNWIWETKLRFRLDFSFCLAMIQVGILKIKAPRRRWPLVRYSLDPYRWSPLEDSGNPRRTWDRTLSNFDNPRKSIGTLELVFQICIGCAIRVIFIISSNTAKMSQLVNRK